MINRRDDLFNSQVGLLPTNLTYLGLIQENLRCLLGAV